MKVSEDDESRNIRQTNPAKQIAIPVEATVRGSVLSGEPPGQREKMV